MILVLSLSVVVKVIPKFVRSFLVMVGSVMTRKQLAASINRKYLALMYSFKWLHFKIRLLYSSFFLLLKNQHLFNKLFFLTSVFTSFCPPLLSDKVAVCFLGWGIHFLIVWKIIHPTVIPCLHNIDWKPDLLGWGNKILFFFGGGALEGRELKF